MKKADRQSRVQCVLLMLLGAGCAGGDSSDSGIISTPSLGPQPSLEASTPPRAEPNPGPAIAGRAATDAMPNAGSGGSSATAAGAAAPPLPSGGAPATPPVPASCGDAPGPTVATDIHGTLTVEDYLDNIGNQTPRPGAAEMLQAYSQRGYFILYITGAPQTIIAETRSWFAEHGFPLERAILTLPEVASLDATVNRDYKTMRLREFLAKGYRVDYAYGDKGSDLQAFQAVGVATDHIFSIGAEAGTLGTRPIDEGTPVDAAGYEDHLAGDVSLLRAICTPTFTGKDIELVD
jgi:hypothetical protein